jgi:hypothetical protein
LKKAVIKTQTAKKAYTTRRLPAGKFLQSRGLPYAYDGQAIAKTKEEVCLKPVE